MLVHGPHLAGRFLIALDLLGTFILALSGEVAGVRGKLDLFGLMVLALAGNVGGIIRNLLIGAVPLSLLSETVSIRA
jgi:uncharacterized membrane protein YeiH